MRRQRYSFIALTILVIFILNGYGASIPVVRWFNHGFMTIVIALWLLQRLRYGRGLPPSPLNKPLLALIGIGFMSVPLSYDPRMAFEYMWIPLIIFSIYLFVVNKFHYAQQRQVIEMVFLVAALTILLGFIQVGSAFFGWGLIRAPGAGWVEFLGTGIPFPVQEDMRIFMPIGVSTQNAGFIVPLLLICITWAMSVTQKGYRIILWTMSALLFVMLVLTFSRGGYIALIAGLFAMFVLRFVRAEQLETLFSRRNMIVLGTLSLLVVLAAASILMISSQRGRRAGDRLRLDLWRSAVQMTVDNPLTGVGTGLFGQALREYRSLEPADDRMSSAHNIYLQAAAENGIGIIVVMAVGFIVVVREWWQLRKRSRPFSARWLRLNGMMAACAAIAVQNGVDTLTSVAAMVLLTVIVVYITVEPAKSRLDEKPKGSRVFSVLLLIVILVYGLWFALIVDPAHAHFRNSLNPEGYDVLEEAQKARNRDPDLTLYSLQVAYLKGKNAIENPIRTYMDDAIVSHEVALVLAPTWDIGMMNLAALYELNGDLEQAEAWLDAARNINYNKSPVNIHWARISEQLGGTDSDAVIAAYVQGLRQTKYLPLSNFWVETELRLQALDAYMELLPIDRQYRVARIHFPDRLWQYIPRNPETAADWWVVGEYALTRGFSHQRVLEAFTNAIELAPSKGDYYASRARAVGQTDLAAAERDLAIARFLGTNDEYPDAIHANLVTDPEEVEAYRRTAIPPLILSQEFEAVSFNSRRGQFVLYPSVRFIGRGASVMQVWYDLAAEYEAQGDEESAADVYQAIMGHAPEDQRAATALDRLDS